MLIVSRLPDWDQWYPDFKIITMYAVDSRYPGDPATAENTEHAMRVCDAGRQAIRSALELPTKGES